MDVLRRFWAVCIFKIQRLSSQHIYMNSIQCLFENSLTRLIERQWAKTHWLLLNFYGVSIFKIKRLSKILYIYERPSFLRKKPTILFLYKNLLIPLLHLPECADSCTFQSTLFVIDNLPTGVTDCFVRTQLASLEFQREKIYIQTFLIVIVCLDPFY